MEGISIEKKNKIRKSVENKEEKKIPIWHLISFHVFLSFFSRIGVESVHYLSATLLFFRRTEEQKKRVSQIVIDGLDIDILYWIQLFCAIIIATFGLLANSIPSVIGAMLISPLLQPIQGIPFALATGRMGLYLRSIKYLFISIFLSFLTAFLLTAIVPFSSLTNEILARTTPTLLDLGVAFASGLIAFLVIGFRKLSGTIVGAAIAASLLPPLCATGIGLYFMDWHVVSGTFLLFLANLIAIIFAGLLFFFIYGFSARSDNGKGTKIMQIVIISITAILMIFPLSESMLRITADIASKKTIETSLKLVLPKIDPTIKVMNLSLHKYEDKYMVTVTLKVPDTKKITVEDKTMITKNLALQLKMPVDLSLELIPITSIYVPKIIEQSFQEKIHTAIVGYLKNGYKGTYILDFVYQKIGTKNIVSLELYNESPIVVSSLIADITKSLTETFREPFFVRVTGEIKEEKQNETGSLLEQELLRQFKVLFPQSTTSLFHLENKGLSGDILHIEFSTVRSKVQTSLLLRTWKTRLEEKMGNTLSLQAKVSYVTVIDF